VKQCHGEVLRVGGLVGPEELGEEPAFESFVVRIVGV